MRKCNGIAAGYHLATNKIPLIYLQNSGFGNIINPLLSLIDKGIFNTSCHFNGLERRAKSNDEPQHLTQGELTLKLIKTLKSTYYILKVMKKKILKN